MPHWGRKCPPLRTSPLIGEPPHEKLLLSTAVLAAVVAFSAAGHADEHFDRHHHRGDKLTIAVFGYFAIHLLDNAPLPLNSVNSDRDVSLVIHVGDIHSGSMACTRAGILPPIPASTPGWNQ